MTSKILEVNQRGEIQVKIVELQEGTIKYWVQAGFGALELDEQGFEDLLVVLGITEQKKRKKKGLFNALFRR